MIKKTEMKQYISWWAFLPLHQFNYTRSLKELRRDFGEVSKMGMLTNATYPDCQYIDFSVDDMNALDTVNDFVKYLEGKGVTKINKWTEGKEWIR